MKIGNKHVKRPAIKPIAESGYEIIRAFNGGGGVAGSYLVAKDGELPSVIKYCDWAGVDGNGSDWLYQQALYMKWFHSQLGDLVPEVYETVRQDGYSFYRMQYRDFMTFSEVLLKQSPETFFEKLEPLIGLLKRNVYVSDKAKQYWTNADKNYFENVYTGRAARRLALLEDKNAVLDRSWKSNRLANTFGRISRAKYLSINGVRYKNVPELLSIFEARKAYFQPVKLVNFAHGDAYLGNIGVNSSGKITLFDLRGRTKDERIDPLYDFGKIAHTFAWDLICRTRSVTADFKNVTFEESGEVAVIALSSALDKADLINKILAVRRRFFEFLQDNSHFNDLLDELGEDRNAAFERIILAEWINLLSDIPNRIEDDPSGDMGLAMYAVGAVMAAEQLQQMDKTAAKRPLLEDILLRPLRQKIFYDNSRMLETAQHLLAEGRSCGVIVTASGQRNLLLDKLISDSKLGSKQVIPYNDALNDPRLSSKIKNKKRPVLLTASLPEFFELEARQPEAFQKISWLLAWPDQPAEPARHKVLVVGASGFWGRAIYSEFKNRGFDVLGTQAHKTLPEFETLDLSKGGAYARFIKRTGFEADTIIYAAGILADDAEQDPGSSLRINVAAIEEIRRLSRAKIIFFSSDQVFGSADEPPYFSYSQPAPLTNYGRHKTMAEELTKDDPRLIAIRAGALYGFNALDDKATFPTTVLKALNAGDEIVADNKREIFPFPIDAAARTVAKLALADHGGYVCAINGEKTTYYDWAKLLQKTFKAGTAGQIKAGDMKKKTVRPQRAQMISIDTPDGLAYETVKLRAALAAATGSRRDCSLIPAPIDMGDEDFFAAGLEELVEAGAREIELDAMDGVFTPGKKDVLERLCFIKTVYPYIKTRVHLMLKNNLEAAIDRYAAAGADIISLHIESFSGQQDLAKALRRIKKHGVKPVLICMPDYEFGLELQSLVMEERIGQIVVMGVTPGVRGQSFRPSAILLVNRIKEFAETKNLGLEIAVDGGLNLEIAGKAAEAGATIFITWSMIARNHDSLAQGYAAVQAFLQSTSDHLESPEWHEKWNLQYKA